MRKNPVPKELVLELKIHRVIGYYYTLGKDGYVYRWRITSRAASCPTCKCIRGKDAKMEPVDLSHLNLSKDVYPVKKEKGWLYYIGKDGNIQRFSTTAWLNR